MVVTVIGAGLAGCEAAWQIAKRGINVDLYEMKPHKYTPAHHSPNFAELVCSNSLRSDRLENAVGLLKEEMRLMDSLIIKCADNVRVPAGGSLAVDREKFSRLVTSKIKENNKIRIINQEVQQIPREGFVVIATGPLTSDALTHSIREFTGNDYLYFYDAAAPIVTYASIDFEKAFMADRYDRGTADYINCPLTNEEYHDFINELINAETAELKSFEDSKVFEGCMPVEVMAKRGEQTLLFGPMKPVGLIDPKTGKEAYAVVQLRRDNKEGTLYNIVGFQTHLKWGEQKRIFGMIPALKNAEFVRYGVMHRNTFINSPKLLDNVYRSKKDPGIFFAGQITGVEGYVESTSSGLIAGINAARMSKGEDAFILPRETANGALSHYISNPTADNFQPMNINFGLLPPLDLRIRNKREKNLKISERALLLLNEKLEYC